jgi:hypothetical protein
MAKKRLGIIQSRGLGDIVIALPIARYYYNEGYEVLWPIAQEFVPSVEKTVPWIKWIPLVADGNNYFYETPMERLKNFKCDEIICLYQSLSSHPEFAKRPEFQITGFDQIKYHIAQVPFKQKWTLAECITRDPQREQALKDRVGIQGDVPYVVVHLEGSDYSTTIDPGWIPEGWKTVEITPVTDCIFDWLSILEGAQSIIAVDSVIANVVDQLGIADEVDSYFLPRSHLHLTPVLGCAWTVLEPNAETLKRITIFRTG